MSTDLPAEGWYEDPYKIHEARWMSDGRPTGLVRDGDAESQDPAPATPMPPGLLAPFRHSGAPMDGADLLRADDDQSLKELNKAEAPFFGAETGEPS